MRQPSDTSARIRPRHLDAAGFTLVELLVVLAVISILASLLISSFRGAKESALSAACSSNLRQIGIALSLYIGDFDAYPLGAVYNPRDFSGKINGDWRDSILPYVQKVWAGGSIRGDLFVCPKAARQNEGAVRMALNNSGTDLSFDHNGMQLSSLGLGHLGNAHDNIPVRESRVVAPSDLIAVLNVSIYGGEFGFGWPGMPWTWHRGGELAVFCDGHVESSRSERIPQITVTNGPWIGSVFKPDSVRARRWNNDNQPHPETWPQN